MSSEPRHGQKLARRSALTLVAGAASLPSILTHPVRAERTREAERPLASQRPVRLIAVHFSQLRDGGFADRLAALEWVTAQAGDVDLVVLLEPRSAPNPTEVQAMEAWARHHQSYVADGGMMGPDGMVAGHRHGDVTVFQTEVGTIAILNNEMHCHAVESKLTDSPIDFLIVDTGAGRAASAGLAMSDISGQGVYTVCIQSKLPGAQPGPVVFAPNGSLVTQAAGGWDHGVVATVNISNPIDSEFLNGT